MYTIKLGILYTCKYIQVCWYAYKQIYTNTYMPFMPQAIPRAICPWLRQPWWHSTGNQATLASLRLYAFTRTKRLLQVPLSSPHEGREKGQGHREGQKRQYQDPIAQSGQSLDLGTQWHDIASRTGSGNASTTKVALLATAGCGTRARRS